jgi:CTP:molybdopterin cytidylyltransferase MocA
MTTEAHARSADVAAIILAAGRSRRMGAFKPLLPFGDGTVIEACIANLRAAQVEQLVVVTGHRANEISGYLNDPKIRFAINPDPESEMAVSIVCGVAQIKTAARAILITPVDHPAADPETISAIIEQWIRGARLIQPEYEGRGGHPVLIDAVFRDELLRLDPAAGLRGFFVAHAAEVLRLPVKSPYIARDMDTWEDYLALHQEVFGRSPRRM